MHIVLKWLRRHGLRLLALIVFGALAAIGTFANAAGKEWNYSWILPKLSPILSLLGAVGARTWAGWSILLGVPLLVVSFFWGRVFCWRFCPMGFLAELAGKLNPWGKTWCRRVPAVNKALALILCVTAACGYPIFLWLDPLCIFNGFFAAWRTPLTLASATIGLAFVAVLMLAAAVPNVWCHRICPLGGIQEALMWAGRRWTAAPGKENASVAQPIAHMGTMTRRVVLAAVPAVVAGLTAKRGLGPNGAKALRPPSADVARINALCARCGNCMKACPYGLIQPDLGSTGIDGLLSPVILFRSQNPKWEPDNDSYCFQDCVRCTQVCPTGALRPITVEEKQSRPIGRAVVDRTRCLAWAKKEYCAVCDEYCPYKAVKLENRNGVNCPVVGPDKCRGCGACEGACPAETTAIIVRPLV